MKRILTKGFILLLVCTLIATMGITVYATELDNVGKFHAASATDIPEPESEPITEPESEPEPKPSTSIIEGIPDSRLDKDEVLDKANAVGDLYVNVGPTTQDIEEANEFILPFVQIANKLMAIILGVTAILMTFITVLDLLYMVFPPVRDILDGGRMGQGNNVDATRRAVGIRSMGAGMDDEIGMQRQGRQASAGGIGGGISAVGRWISDEAMAACLESQAHSVKSILAGYFKKRSVFLIIYGICVVLFTSTVFTDLGIRLGMWALTLIMKI